VALAFAGTAGAERYIVLYKNHVAAPVAAQNVTRAGGQIVATYPEIGVVVAESSSESFEALVERFPRVLGAAASATHASAAATEEAEWGLRGGSLENEPAADADTYSSMQWGLAQIHGPEAHAITGGSPEVLVGHIDTGVDASHPDLAPNLDAATSVSCVGGAPNQDPAAWRDDSGHGTHTAAIVAGASNGTGIVGVAPNVKLAAIKASVRRGTSDIFLPEAVVCSFMWAAAHGIDVANNSYSVDSALVGGTTSFCRDDPNEQTIIESVRRSVQWAMFRGVSVVASAGNSNAELVEDECLRLPSELPGVVTVAATGPSGQRSSFSNYGLGVVDVAAPGGEVPPFALPPASFVLSAWPSYLQVPRLLCDAPAAVCPPPDGTRSYYRFMAGTSQAAAHASGVAALVVSRFGKSRPAFIGQLRPARVAAILLATADAQPCPAGDARCRADGDVNGFYGHGIVNALSAVASEPAG